MVSIFNPISKLFFYHPGTIFSGHLEQWMSISFFLRHKSLWMWFFLSTKAHFYQSKDKVHYFLHQGSFCLLLHHHGFVSIKPWGINPSEPKSVSSIILDFFCWCFQPIWKICLSNWIIPPGRSEHIKHLKPPPRFGLSTFPVDSGKWRFPRFLCWIYVGLLFFPTPRPTEKH